jgi:hypothetical protein
VSAYPAFGAAGACEDETLSYNTEQLEFRDGFDTDMFSLRKTYTLTRSNPSVYAGTYGIGKSSDPTRNSLGAVLETVTLVEEEEITPPHYVAARPGVSPSLGETLTYADGMIFHRVKETLTVVGFGSPPQGLGEEDIGATYAGTITIRPAVGDAPSVSGSGWYVSRVEITRRVTDWQKFTVELVRYVGNSAANADVNQLTPLLFSSSELSALSSLYKLRRTTTLHQKDRANVEETVELYEDTAS